MLRGLAKGYGDAVALHPTDLDIEHGEFVVVVGPSGCGKSTLLRLLAGREVVPEPHPAQIAKVRQRVDVEIGEAQQQRGGGWQGEQPKSRRPAGSSRRGFVEGHSAAGSEARALEVATAPPVTQQGLGLLFGEGGLD